MAAPWIEVRDLDLSRGGRPVLRSITASLSGRAIGLVGSNGAGKSTLIGAILGVLRAERGSIQVLDLEVPARALEVRARSGVMAEQAGIYPGASGVDAVTYAGMLSGLPRRESLRRAHRALDALDVGEERYRLTEAYSTGMRQRCKLAMSLVHDPEVLILDEPTVGLDPPGRVQLLELIRDLRDEGRRILLSTHILPDAEFLCDELLLLEQGAVGYSGPMQSLISEAPGDLLAEVSGPAAQAVERLQEGGIAASNTATHVRFVAASDDDLRAFWNIAAELQMEVRRLDRTSLTLEDAVIDAMEQAADRIAGGSGPAAPVPELGDGATSPDGTTPGSEEGPGRRTRDRATPTTDRTQDRATPTTDRTRDGATPTTERTRDEATPPSDREAPNG